MYFSVFEAYDVRTYVVRPYISELCIFFSPVYVVFPYNVYRPCIIYVRVYIVHYTPYTAHCIPHTMYKYP